MATTLADRWSVIQAEAHGVTGTRSDGSEFLARKLSDVAPGGYYVIVRPPEKVNPGRTLRFARGEVGAHYGFVTVGSIAIDLVTPSWLHFPFRRPGTWICSAIAAEALRYGGWYHRWPTTYGCTPAQVLHALLDEGCKEIPLQTAQAGDIGFAHSTGVIGAAIRLAQRFDHEATWELNHSFLLDRCAPTPAEAASTGLRSVDLPEAA